MCSRHPSFISMAAVAHEPGTERVRPSPGRRLRDPRRQIRYDQALIWQELRRLRRNARPVPVS